MPWYGWFVRATKETDRLGVVSSMLLKKICKETEQKGNDITETGVVAAYNKETFIERTGHFVWI